MDRPSMEGAISILETSFKFFGDLAQVFQGDFGVGDFPAAEADGDFHLHAVFQPATGVFHFEAAMMLVRFWPQPDLFNFDFGLRFSRWPFLFILLKNIFSQVQYLADWRIRVSGDLHQVKAGVLCRPEEQFQLELRLYFPLFRRLI